MRMFKLGLCSALLFVFAATFAAGQASAATIGIALSSDNSVCALNGTVGGCFQNGGTDYGASWSTSGGVSSNLVGVGSTSTGFSIDAVTAIDGGGDATLQARLNFDLTLTINVDNPVHTWTVDLNQGALGLLALRGDGTASAVGTQQNGNAMISAISTSVNASNYNFSLTNNSLTGNPSNNSSQTLEASGTRIDSGVLSGTGSGTFAVNIDFDLSAFTNDGCSGFICSSISGGEEAGVLFGDQDAMDQAVDDYSTYGRSQGPDGYNSTYTLNVTSVPEPGTAMLLGLGLAGLAYGRRTLR